jgi:hypothetical protein
MRKVIALAIVAVFAGMPAAASAHPKKAKVYRGSFQLVGADGSYTRDSFGKAQLVVNKRNAKLSVHVRKLGSRVTYTFRLQSAAEACTAGAAGGTDVAGWKYRRDGVLVTNRHGVANSWAKARSFRVDRSVEYFVGVFDSSKRLVACAQLTKKHKAKKGHGKPGSDKPKGHDKPKGGDDGAKGQSRDDHGKAGDDHGKAGDDHGKAGDDHGKAGDDHGKSGDAPGHNKDKGRPKR